MEEEDAETVERREEDRATRTAAPREKSGEEAPGGAAKAEVAAEVSSCRKLRPVQWCVDARFSLGRGRGRKRKANSDSDEASSGGSGSDRPKKKKAAGGFGKSLALSEELSDIVGVKEAPRHEVVKQVWAYIREHNLQDPKNKQVHIDY